MTLIRKIYLYLFSLIGLVLVVIGCVQLVNLGLKAYIFTAADQYYSYPIALLPRSQPVMSHRRFLRSRRTRRCRHIKTSRRQANAKARLRTRWP